MKLIVRILEITIGICVFMSCSFFSLSDVENVKINAKPDKIHISWDNPTGIYDYSILIEVYSKSIPISAGEPELVATYNISNGKNSYTIENIDLTKFPNWMIIYVKDSSSKLSNGKYIFDLWSSYTPVADKQEPNNDKVNSSRIIENTPYYCTLDSINDNDWFNFDVDKGKMYSVAIIGGAKDTDYRNFNINFYHENGVEIHPVGGDSSGKRYSGIFYPQENETVSLKVSNPEKITDYILYIHSYQFGEDLYEPNNDIETAVPLNIDEIKSLSIHTNTDEDFFRFNGRSGTSYTIYTTPRDETNSWYMNKKIQGMIYYIDLLNPGSNYNSYNEYHWDCVDSREYYFKIAGGIAHAYDISIKEADIQADEYESDNSLQTATLIPLDTKQFHTLHKSNDIDWFKLNAEIGTTYLIYIDGFHKMDGISGLQDLEVTLYDIDGYSILHESFGIINWVAPSTNEYYIQVKGNDSLKIGQYTISLERL